MQQQQRSCMNSISSPAHETHHKDAEWFSLYTELVARLSRGCFGQTYFQKVPGACLWFLCHVRGLCRAGGEKRVDSDEAMVSLKEGQLRHPEKQSK